MTDLPDPPRSIVAVFSSTGPETPSARSAPIILGEGTGFSMSWLLWLPLVLCALFLLGTRTRPLETASAPVHGITLRGETTREPTFVIAGRMMRTTEAIPLAGVLRAMSGSDVAAELSIGADGMFSLELSEGEYELVFLSPGFASEFFPVAIPHAGQRLEVQLERWRQRAARILFDTVERLSGRRPHGTTVHDLKRDPNVGSLASQVEVVSYGPGTRDGASVGAVQEAADRLRRSTEGESQ